MAKVPKFSLALHISSPEPWFQMLRSVWEEQLPGICLAQGRGQASHAGPSLQAGCLATLAVSSPQPLKSCCVLGGGVRAGISFIACVSRPGEDWNLAMADAKARAEEREEWHRKLRALQQSEANMIRDSASELHEASALKQKEAEAETLARERAELEAEARRLSSELELAKRQGAMQAKEAEAAARAAQRDEEVGGR